MAEEEKKAPVEEPQKPSISDEELALLRGSTEKYNKLAEIAKASECETVEEYLDLLEETAYSKITEEKPVNTEEEKPVERTASEPAPTHGGISPEIKQMIQEANQRAAQAAITAQWSEFRMFQRDLPEGERSKYSKEDLMKVLTRNGAKVQAVVDQFDGNVFAAAEFIKSVPDLRKRAKDQGVASEKAKDAAASSTEVGNDGRVAAPSTETAEERTARLNKERADAIAPDQEYQYPG